VSTILGNTPDAREALKDTFDRQAQLICLALQQKDPGSQWQISDRSEFRGEWVRLVNRLTINDRAPERIRLSLDTYDRRIKAYGQYGQRLDGYQWLPRDAVRDADDPQPTMSADKTPAQIAADLCRRLLPRYREYLGVYRQQLVAALQLREATHETAVELIKASAGRLKPWGTAWDAKDPRTLTAHVDYQAYQGVSRGEVEVSGDRVEVKLTVDVERARQLVAWLAEQPRVEAEGGE
jgi:hypothetical protein